MVILRTRNKITDFLMILAWASPFKISRTYTKLLLKRYITQLCSVFNSENMTRQTQKNMKSETVFFFLNGI